MNIGFRGRIGLLESLKKFCEEKTASIYLPMSLQKGDQETAERAPEVYKMRLPSSSSAKKYAPYILIQFVNGMDKQPHGMNSDSTSLVRFIFCVYNDNEEQGAIMLLNLMETIRIALMKVVVIDQRYKLDTDSGLESLAYLDDTAPYFAGELVGTFIEAPIEREVNLREI